MITYKKYSSLFLALLFSSFTSTFFIGCKDDEEPPVPVLETGTMTDIDGTIYKTVKIGDKWWMAENLRVTQFRNGTTLLDRGNEADWQTGLPARCDYPLSPDTVGLLYNYAAVTSPDNLAPEGWRVPTDDDWKQLEKHLGMSDTEANKLAWRGTNQAEQLRIASPIGWEVYGNVWNTNSSGFSADAGSCRLHDGTFGSPGLFSTGFWWTVSEYTPTEAFYRYMDYKNANIFRSHTLKNYGMSVRCVKI